MSSCPQIGQLVPDAEPKCLGRSASILSSGQVFSGKLSRKSRSYGLVGEAPTNEVLLGLATSASMAALNATTGMETVHRIKAIAEPARRHGHFDDMWKVALIGC
jgi:hypothetical protein